MHMRQQITPITTSPPTLVPPVITDGTGSSGVVIQSSNWRVLASVYENIQGVPKKSVIYESWHCVTIYAVNT